MKELYEWPPTRSQRAKWALEELGIEYSSHRINLQEGQRDGEVLDLLGNLEEVHPFEV